MKVTDAALANHRKNYLPAWAREGAPTTIAEDYEFARQETAGSISGDDLIDELVDVSDALARLARAGDHEAAGFIVCAVFDAYVRRVTDRAVFGSPGVGSMSAKAAALDAVRNVVKRDDTTRNALIRASILAEARRFA